MKKTIYFDMDGTLAALFFVKDFSKRLDNGDMTAYTDAKTLFNPIEMRGLIESLKKSYDIGIISYADNEYLHEAAIAKIKWLNKNFPYADANKIHIVTRETPKESYYADGDILVDDAKANRQAWEKRGGKTIDAYYKRKAMIKGLKDLIA